MKLKAIKKAACIFVAVSLSASVLFGCDSKKIQKDELAVINVWTGDTGSRVAYDKAVYEFNNSIGAKNGVKVVYEAKENLSSAITVALQTGQAPEIFMSGDVCEYADQGYIIPLDDLKGGKDLIEKRRKFLTEGRQVYNGKTYSVPYAATTRGLIYNKDMFKEAGLVDEKGEPTPPKTLDEVRSYAKKLTNLKKNKYGIVLPLKWLGMFECDILSDAVASTGSDGYDYTTGKYDYSGYKKILEMYLGIKEDKSYMPGAEGLENDAARARFAEGNIGMKFAVSWDVGVLNDQFVAKCDWDVAPLPVIDENNKYYQNMTVNTGFKINKTAPDKVGEDKLMFVYNWLNSDELAKRVYELGANLPLDFSVVKDVDTSKLKKGWEGFARMSEISVIMPAKPSVDISGETDFPTNFFNSVWPGKMTPDEAIQEANRVMNDGIKKYAEIHPETSPDSYIISDWNIKREK